MVRVILLRHGETEWNRDLRYQGKTDIELSPQGKEQAGLLAERLAHQKVHAIYSSDLKRAWATAAAISAYHGLEVVAEPRLREMDFGVWEGLTHAEIQGRFPEEMVRWEDNPLVEAPPGGESFGQVVARGKEALNEIIRRHQGATVLIVAHSGSLQALLCAALGINPPARGRFRLDPASISELLLHDEGAVLTLLNDTSHLKLVS